MTIRAFTILGILLLMPSLASAHSSVVSRSTVNDKQGIDLLWGVKVPQRVSLRCRLCCRCQRISTTSREDQVFMKEKCKAS
jgi:hypothetical protein